MRFSNLKIFNHLKEDLNKGLSLSFCLQVKFLLGKCHIYIDILSSLIVRLLSYRKPPAYIITVFDYVLN